MESPLVPAGILIAAATLFGFLNGLHDGANAVATVIASRAMTPRRALWMVSLAEFSGPFILGTAVAQTIGADIVDPAAVTVTVLIATLMSASLWNLLTWRLGIPTSSSHALIGGLIGAALTANRFNLALLHEAGLIKVFLGLFLAPIVTLILASLVMRLSVLLLRGATPRANIFFKRGQLVTTLGLAISHGANDAPKTMGIMTLGLVATGFLTEFRVPLWVIILAAGAMALGTLLGGWNLVRTIGMRFYRVRAIHAFNAQITSGAMVLAASLIGSPVSTSQVVSSAIAGVGAADRLTRVRWGVVGEIVRGWLFTIPVTALAGGLLYLLLGQWLGR